MTAPVSPAPRRKWFRRLFLFLGLLFCVAVLLLGGFVLWFYRAAHNALAQLDGTITVQGLHATATVDRDEHGVPHVSASSVEDLVFVQGYVTAQDRLWQMDMARRTIAGETAEILPRMTGNWVDHDIRQRTFRLKAVAAAAEAQLSQRDRTFLDAYARGVSAFIEQHQGSLPIEFRILRYKPKPWSAQDCLLVAVGMNQLLNAQFEIEYWREKISSGLSPDLAKDLFPGTSPHDHSPFDQGGIHGEGRATGSPSPTGAGESHLWSSPIRNERELSPEPFLPGSNNWVISGAHSRTGKPLLSNDMHLAHQLPGIWYEIQLHSGNFNVAGFSLPGTPFVLVGHNQRIAWGFTNLNIDVQDLFIENFNAAGEYQTPKGWEKPQIYREVIHVNDAADRTVDVVATRHGPLVSRFFPGETRKIALEWIIYDYPQIRFPVFDLDSAQNWQEFRQALSGFVAPSQNVVYADVDGHIGYQAMGIAPIRAAGDGTLPQEGSDGKYDWVGFLPFEKLPSLFDPPSGMIATANARITPDRYPYVLTTQWLPPYREERIYEVLSSGGHFTTADMLKLQTDVIAEYDLYFAKRFAQAVDHNPKASDRARKAAEMLRNFDGRMQADSVAATIEVTARQKLFNKLLMEKLGQHWGQYRWFEASVALENIIRDQPERWLPAGVSSFDQLLANAVEEALKEAPSNLDSWRFGDAFPVEINHPLFGMVPILRRWAGPGIHSQSGGSNTVKQVGRHFGPSERMTVDLSNLDQSNFNLVTGESGQLYSPYYMDHWPYWYSDTTFAFPFSDQAITLSRAHELIFKPN